MRRAAATCLALAPVWAGAQQDAADAPEARWRVAVGAGDRTQYYAGAFLTYRFGNTPGPREPAGPL